MENIVWFITGSSRGFGRLLAERLIARGDRVVATARRSEDVADLVDLAPDRVIGSALDVADPEQAEAAVQEALDRFGQIDVLVNNAGYALMGAVECTSLREARDQFDANFFGPFNVTAAALPSMRARGSGLIVNVASLGGLSGFPGVGIYCASKFALEGMSEALAAELRGFGIEVMIIEPGAFRTNLGPAARIAEGVPAYDALSKAVRQGAVEGSRSYPDPSFMIDGLIAAIDAPRRAGRIMLGDDALDAARAKIAALTEQLAASEALRAGCPG
jgi:NAD(P)-dependent dehydrogenase (short-subunit alcohol dehydrogenase family)